MTVKPYIELENDKWKHEVKKNCSARINNQWIKNTCRITDEECQKGNCFALQIIKTAKGFL